MSVAAIVAAGGTGTRLKARRHKSFVPVAGRPMLGWVLRALQRAPSVQDILIVAHPDDLAAARALARKEKVGKLAGVVAGGHTRMASVRCGLNALPERAKWVLVHDAARPLVTPELIEATVKAARVAKAAIAAVPVVPTIKQGKNGWVVRTLDRSTLWAVQTPQVFERKLLERAHARSNDFEATDDAALVEKMGGKVRIVPGLEGNIKVTTPEDLKIAESLLRGRS